MEVALRYGRGELRLTLPDDLEVTVIRKPEAPPLSDPQAAIRAALAAPVGAPPLHEAAAGARSACILICDVTRPVPNGLFLGPLIRELLAAGIPAGAITVLVATGLHRPNEGEELAEVVGDPWVLRTVAVENHFALRDEDHVDLGRTPTRGTRVRLDRRFVEADVRIATGLVEPHFMAGYSGGRKVIAPGIAHAETITTFHSARFMEHPKAASCVIEHNPLHEEQVEIVRMVGGALALNTVIDEARRLMYVSFGEVLESHALAVAEARRLCEVAVPRRFATILTSAAGHPLDATYYQTVKAMVTPLEVLEQGGDVVVVSQCSEGMGSAAYVEAQKRLVALGPEGFVREIAAKRHAGIDEWETEEQVKAMRAGTIHLFSGGLPAGMRCWTGVNVVRDPVRAVADSVARTGERCVAVIPEGPYVVPRLRPPVDADAAAAARPG